MENEGPEVNNLCEDGESSSDEVRMNDDFTLKPVMCKQGRVPPVR